MLEMATYAPSNPSPVLAQIIHDPGNCATHCRSHVRQNVVVTLGHAPRSGERSYKPVNNPG